MKEIQVAINQAKTGLINGTKLFSCTALWYFLGDTEEVSREQRAAVANEYEKLVLASGYFTKKKIPVGDMIAEEISGNDKFDKLSDAKQLEIRLALLDKLAVLYAN